MLRKSFGKLNCCPVENETCQDMGGWGRFCGTNFCQLKTDCKNIGHIVQGAFHVIACDVSKCEYRKTQ